MIMAWLPRKKNFVREGPRYAIDRLHTEMDRLFDRFFAESSPEPFGRGIPEAAWVAAVDISETDEEITVKADIPGIPPDAIDIQIQRDVLHIKGEKKEEKEKNEKTYHRVERRYGAFVRSLALPGSVDVQKISASHKNGVLTVRLPKLEKEKAKRLSIQVE
jgi:HSP20 family protein